MPEGLSKLGGSSVLRDALAVTAIAVLPLWQALAGVAGPVDSTLNIGPNDAAYVSGFYPNYEIENENKLATRWSTYDASVALPLWVDGGPVELSYRVARVLPQTAEVEVFFGGDLVDRFTCRGGVYLVRRVRLAALPTTPVHLDFKIDSHDRRNLGLKFDWVRVKVGGSGSVLLSSWHRWHVLFFVLFLFGLYRWVGFTSVAAFAWALPLSLLASAWTKLDPFAVAHVVPKIATPAVGLSIASALVVRKERLGRWVVLVFVVGFILKGVGLFHPRYFYIDIQNHRRYLNAFVEASGGVVERGIAAQKAVNTAYPRNIAGKDYAFPYSPLFFVPFAWLPQDSERIDNSMKHVGLAAAAAQVIVVYWLGRTAVGGAVGLLAALFHAFLPPLYSRLLLAMWPTIWAQLLDSLAILVALSLSFKPDEGRRYLGLAVLTLASFLSYITSLFTLSLFLLLLALLVRRLGRRLLVIVVGGAAATVLLLYRSFALAFFQEILPALLREGTGASTAPSTLTDALARIPLFYGYAYPVLALGGLVWMRRRGAPQAFQTLLAYGLAFAALVALRGLGGGLFKDLKEILFVAPLVAILTAVAVRAVARTSRLGMGAAIVLSIGLVAFGMSRYRHYFQTYAYPAVSAIDETGFAESASDSSATGAVVTVPN